MSKRGTLIWLAWLVAACGEEPTSASQASRDAAASASTSSAEGERLACDQDELELSRTFASHWQGCSKDDDCTLATLDAGCASPFLCATAFNVRSDRTALDNEARALASAFAEKCWCAEADCPSASTLHARCDVGAGQCFASSI